jgi:hypothetical protein
LILISPDSCWLYITACGGTTFDLFFSNAAHLNKEGIETVDVVEFFIQGNCKGF